MSKNGKLEGIKVLDLSRFLPGPHLTMLMADHGAEVIKIEAPGDGEPTRYIGPQQGKTSTYYRNTNRGKQSISIDLKSSRGVEVFLKLAQDADVIVESFRPGVAERLGVGYRQVSEIAPQIVYCSLSAFGQTGPWAGRPAHDLSIQALTGTLSMSGASGGEDGTPSMPGAPAADIAGSLMALSGILLGILQARMTGEGDYLDVGMYDSLLAWQPHSTLTTLALDEAPVPSEDRVFGGSAMYSVYETSDGRWITLGGSEPQFIRNLVDSLGRPDLYEVGLRPPGPQQNPLRHFLEKTFLTKTQQEWNEWFADKDVCYAPVLDMREALEQSQALARKAIVKDGDGIRHLANPIRFMNEPAVIDPYVADISADSKTILTSVGYSSAEIERLTSKDGPIG